MIRYLADATLARAMRATVERSVRLDPMADDFAAAVVTGGGELVNRAFETIECVRRAVANHVEREMVFVAADFTLGHAQGDTV